MTGLRPMGRAQNQLAVHLAERVSFVKKNIFWSFLFHSHSYIVNFSPQDQVISRILKCPSRSPSSPTLLPTIAECSGKSTTSGCTSSRQERYKCGTDYFSVKWCTGAWGIRYPCGFNDKYCTRTVTTDNGKKYISAPRGLCSTRVAPRRLLHAGRRVAPRGLLHAD